LWKSGIRPSDLEETSRRSPLIFPARQHAEGSEDKDGGISLWPGSRNKQSDEGFRVVSGIELG